MRREKYHKPSSNAKTPIPCRKSHHSFAALDSLSPHRRYMVATTTRGKAVGNAGKFEKVIAGHLRANCFASRRVIIELSNHLQDC
jgi:hypothetical protein